MNDVLLKDAIVEIRTCGEFLVKYAATLEEELKKRIIRNRWLKQ